VPVVVVGSVRRGAYFDSVTLMSVAHAIGGLPGVQDAALVMGTVENKAILREADLLMAEFDAAGGSDLLAAVKAENAAAAAGALRAVTERLETIRRRDAAEEVFQPLSLGGALNMMSEANLALISVAGRYAGAEAMKALRRGLHVMLFSDNVPLPVEVQLKEFADRNGLLVMGPDCGTAIINGAPLGFANAVSRGPVGIVGASGTGIQEISTIVSREGSGISQAIGTGGRDVKSAVGGVTFLAALSALAEDDETRVIVLVAKPPDADVHERIMAKAARAAKPIVSVFLGRPASDGREAAPVGEAATLEEAALRAVAAARGEDPRATLKRLAARDETIGERAAEEARRRRPGQRYLRGLMSGGTFAAEAQIVASDLISDLFANAPAGLAVPLDDARRSRRNSIVDLGADEFTVGRPHPMIDGSVRHARIAREATDPETAVILLDVVLGHGAHPDPAAELAPVVREAVRHVCVVCSVTGTDRDPQNRSRVAAALVEAGAVLMPSNAAASLFAASIVRNLKGAR
jgi:FdrA protein